MVNNYKTYDIAISTRDVNNDLNELETWISKIIKHQWSKKEYKTKIVYTFNDLDDAFNFKMRWSYG